MKNKNINGFTLVETLITLLAVTIMIGGPLAFMYRSYSYADLVNSRVISVALAQEGLELATALRNYNLTDFQNMANNCSGGCMLDWDGTSQTPTYTPCTLDGCKLYKVGSDDRQMYKTTGDIDTGFYRSVKFTYNGTSGYNVESSVWNYVDNTKVEAKLNKWIFNIQIK